MGNQLKALSFDRVIIALTAYENLLAIVYHDSIPVDGCQVLTMQLFVVKDENTRLLKVNTCHVPIKPKSTLKYFRFTEEGMLVSHDSAGFVRIYNI